MITFVTALAIQTKWTFTYKGKEESITFYKGCTYSVELWGANGGNGCLNKDCTKAGGIGAYIKGNVKFNINQDMKIRIGGKGEDGKPNAAVNRGLGGWNGGGDAGEDTGAFGGDDPSGGGGGRSDLWFNTSIIMAAGGGSGSGCDCIGAPGGNVGYFGYITSAEKVDFRTSGGTGTVDGGDGVYSPNCPGSGGGGGWKGGQGGEGAWTNHYKAIAEGGSSGYASAYVSSVKSSRGTSAPSKSGLNGYGIINLLNSDSPSCEVPRPTPSTTELPQKGKPKRSKLFDVAISVSLLNHF